MYITRNIEDTVENVSSNFKVMLLTGARQVGKTTLLKRMTLGTERKYVTLDDLMERSLAISDPALFMQCYCPPVLIDEIQYAPELLNYIKNYIEYDDKNGSIWLTSSQPISTAKAVLNILGDQVGILNLYGLTINEISKNSYKSHFLPIYDNLLLRSGNTIKRNLNEIFKLIWQGSMPSSYNVDTYDWKTYYASYTKTIIQQEIMKVLQINDEMTFFHFLCAAAGQTGRIVNYAELAKAADISAPTAKQWVTALEAVGVLYMLQPFSPPGAKYVVKAPKLYFCDTGLAAYLTNWNSFEALETGALSNEFFITWVTMEILKSYSNIGKVPPIFYFRNFNGNEIELIIYEDGTAYPIAIKKCSNLSRILKTFAILEPVARDSNLKVGSGGVICFAEKLISTDKNISIIPAWII